LLEIYILKITLQDKIVIVVNIQENFLYGLIDQVLANTYYSNLTIAILFATLKIYKEDT